MSRSLQSMTNAPATTAEQEGWRPRVHAWINLRFPSVVGHPMITSSVGNVGSKVLSFLTEVWMPYAGGGDAHA